MPLITRIQAFLVVAVCAAALGCNQTGYFVPGESSTVTPSYNAEGSPSAPIIITETCQPAGDGSTVASFRHKERTLGCCLTAIRSPWAPSSMTAVIAGS